MLEIFREVVLESGDAGELDTFRKLHRLSIIFVVHCGLTVCLIHNLILSHLNIGLATLRGQAC